MVDLSSFDSLYEKAIRGRSFVEYDAYYDGSRQRYRQVFEVIAGLGLPAGTRHLDIGGGQMALLSRKLLGFDAHAGDVVDTAAGDVADFDVPWQTINLMDDHLDTGGERFDLVSLLEVIEHIPVPPYVVLGKLREILAPGGYLVMTTPNGFRIRNILRMLANREVLDIYRYPEGDTPLGHQHEYTMRQLDWQLRKAGFDPLVMRHYVSGWRGATPVARIMHWLTAPAALVPHLRDGLMVVARMQQA